MNKLSNILTLLSLCLLISCSQEQGQIIPGEFSPDTSDLYPEVSDNNPDGVGNDKTSPGIGSDSGSDQIAGDDTLATKSPAHFNGAVTLVKELDSGGTLVSGEFSQYGDDTVLSLVKLNPEGTLDKNFNENLGGSINGPIYSIAEQDDGTILIGGHFSYVGQLGVNSYVVLNSDGSVNSDLTTKIGNGVYGQVKTIVEDPNGEIVIAGNFTRVNETEATSIQILTQAGEVVGDDLAKQVFENLEQNAEEPISCQNIHSRIKLAKDKFATAKSTRVKQSMSQVKKELRAYKYFIAKSQCPSSDSDPSNQAQTNDSENIQLAENSDSKASFDSDSKKEPSPNQGSDNKEMQGENSDRDPASVNSSMSIKKEGNKNPKKHGDSKGESHDSKSGSRDSKSGSRDSKSESRDSDS